MNRVVPRLQAWLARECEIAHARAEGDLSPTALLRETVRIQTLLEVTRLIEKEELMVMRQNLPRRPLLAVALLCVLAAPVRADNGYRLDCESPASWVSHVGQAARRFMSATVAAGVNSIWDVIPRASIEGDAGNIQGRLVAFGLVLAGHISPQALLEFAGAVVCVVRDDEEPMD